MGNRPFKIVQAAALALAMGVGLNPAHAEERFLGRAPASVISCVINAIGKRLHPEPEPLDPLLLAWKQMESGQMIEGEQTLKKVEDHLRELAGRKVIKRKDAGGQSGATWIVTFENGEKAVFKADHSFVKSQVYKNEIATYLLDRLFHFNLVPPMIEVEMDGIKGVIMPFLTSRGHPGTSVTEGVDAVHEILMLDVLIGNYDRHSENILLVGPDRRSVAIDHSGSFGRSDSAPSELYLEAHFPKAAFREKWTAPTDAQIRAVLAPLLESKQIEALIARRNGTTAEWSKIKSDAKKP